MCLNLKMKLFQWLMDIELLKKIMNSLLYMNPKLVNQNYINISNHYSK